MTCFDWNIMIVMLDIHLCKNYILITTYHTNEWMKKKKTMHNIFFSPPNNVCLREDDIYSMVQYLNETLFFQKLKQFLGS